MKRSLAFSLCLHLLLLAPLVPHVGCKRGEGGKGQPGGSMDTIQAPPAPIEVTLFDPHPGTLKKAKPLGDRPETCKGGKFYGGVGIMHGNLDGMVTKAPKGYPAYEAGVRVGDILLTLDLKGEVGTPVVISVLREGKQLNFPAVRATICYEKRR